MQAPRGQGHARLILHCALEPGTGQVPSKCSVWSLRAEKSPRDGLTHSHVQYSLPSKQPSVRTEPLNETASDGNLLLSKAAHCVVKWF